MDPNQRRCVGAPPAGYYTCPRPATHWQVRIWGQGTMFGEYPMHLDLCADHYGATLGRSDVRSHGSH